MSVCKKYTYHLLIAALFLFMTIGCQGLDDGLNAADRSGIGPEIVFDFDNQPLPDIPFPNNLATILDKTSPTGRHVNVSLIAKTKLESDLREKVNKLDGFGTYQGITIAFDQPLYVQDIIDRHHDANLDPQNDAVFLINIDPESPKYGMAIPLDIGQGNFPALMDPIPGDMYSPERRVCPGYLGGFNQEDTDVDGDSDGEGSEDDEGEIELSAKDILTTGYFNHCDPIWGNTIADPHIDGTNLLFESHEEDLNGNGILDPGEDIDDDGVLDTPNVPNKGDDPWLHLMTFYEKETNTLIMHPLLALEEQTTYAVVITNRLRGLDPDDESKPGDPIRSPFNSINHLKQTYELAPLVAILGGAFKMEGDSSGQDISLSLDDVAFTWSFTTQTITRDLIEIRKGMWGVGALSWLGEQYPPDLSQVDQLTLIEEDDPETKSFDERNQYVLPIENFKEILRIAGAMLLAESVGEEHAADSIDFMVETLGSVDYVVSGRFDVPYFLADQDGIGTEMYAADNNESFDIDVKNGKAHVGTDEVTWWCFVPKETEYAKQPFPVSLYSHGYSGNRFETIGFASLLSRYGIATCGMDLVGHGLVIPPTFLEDPLVKMLLDNMLVTPTIDSIANGRARDLNNDGMPDSGGDFWSADSFHTKDIVRQSVVDTMQFLRILRSFDGKKEWPKSVFEDDAEYFLEGKPAKVAGDFNRDGVPDFGGPNQDYYAWGQSLGGFVSSLVAAVDPSIVASAPVSGGAGLIDVGIRTIQEGVIQAVFLAFMGPFVYAQPVPGTDQVSFGFIVADNTRWWGNNDGVHEYFIRDFARTRKNSANPPEPMDKIVLINMISGDEFSCTLSKDLICRTGFAADALDATEKRHLLNMPDEWYFRGSLETTPIRDGKITFWEPTTDEKAEMSDEELRLHELRSEIQWIPDSTKVGDQIRIELRSPDGTVKQVISKWGQNTDAEAGKPYMGGFYQGFFFKPDDKLVSPAEGFGKKRQSPDFRRLLTIASMIMDPSDPAPWVKHLYERPIDFSEIPEDKALYDFRKDREAKDWQPHVNMLVIPTSGDMNVPIATEINMPRAAGMIEMFEPRASFDNLFCEGRSYSENDMLIYSKTIEAIDFLRYFDNACFADPRALNFDPDNLDNGLDDMDAPSPNEPLRATVVSRQQDASTTWEKMADRRPEFISRDDEGNGYYTDPNGVSAMRIPYLEHVGVHGFVTPSPYKQYDIDQHMINMIGRYFQSRGKELWDDVCLMDSTCDYFDEDFFAIPPED